MSFSYIGITDFETPEQVRDMLKVFSEATQRKLMIGVMMSFKTLIGIPTKWSNVWISKERIASVFIDHPRVFNTLHYADYDGNTVLAHLLDAVSFGGEYIQGLQFDMVWPSPQMVIAFRREHPDILVVLQVNGKALELVHDDPSMLVNRLAEYGDSIDFVLLDKSMGRGLGMDAKGLIPFATAVRSMDSSVGIAAAGGLGPETMHRANPLVREFPDLSIDAQGKLKPDGDSMKPTDWYLASQYLSEALRMFAS